MRPIVGLTESLPKEALEAIVVEAIYRHRHLHDIAELRHAESRRSSERGHHDGDARTAYVRAMIDVHAQQAVLSALLEVLGFVPEAPST